MALSKGFARKPRSCVFVRLMLETSGSVHASAMDSHSSDEGSSGYASWCSRLVLRRYACHNESGKKPEVHSEAGKLAYVPGVTFRCGVLL